MAASNELAKVSGPISLYYSDSHNDQLQSQNVTYDTRFRSGFQTLGAGQQVVQIPVDGGLSRCCLVFGWDAGALSGLGEFDLIPKAFGYQAIESITWRVAGSSEYRLTGAQLLAKNLRLASNSGTKQAIYDLAGSEQLGPTDAASYAFIPLPLWTMPDNGGFANPINGDLLAQQVQIRVQMRAPSAYMFSPGAGTAVVAAVSPPAAYSVGYFQAEFLRLVDRAQSIAPKVQEDTYVSPLACDFDQSELSLPLPAGSAANTPLTFSGLIFGQTKMVQVFLTSNDPDDAANGSVYAAPLSVQMTYAGTVYASYDNFSSRIWNVMDGNAPSAVSGNNRVVAAGAWVTTPAVVSTLSEYVNLPLSQPISNDHATEIQVHGMNVSNGSITLNITAPDTTKAYTVHVVPVLRGALSYSRGSCNILVG